ncbi:putative membrane protein [Staphylococcus aureus]|nr:putative membrane protein [Staphylococcus aureus]
MPFAFLSPLSASVLNFVLLAAVNAVSLPEKKNEININIIMAMITRVVSLLSYLIFIVVT